MIRNTRQVEEQVLQQQHLQLQQQHHHQQVLQQQEEFLRMHEFHKRNNLVNNMGIAHTNGLPAGKYIRRKAQFQESLHFNLIFLNHFQTFLGIFQTAQLMPIGPRNHTDLLQCNISLHTLCSNSNPKRIS